MTNDVVVGNVRVQLLSDTLVRIEYRGTQQFEDRNTFLVVNRKWPSTPYRVEKQDGETIVATDTYNVRIKRDGKSLKGVRIELKDGDGLYDFTGKIPKVSYFPKPGEELRIWLLPDIPRVIPPAWGAVPSPKKLAADENGGWEVVNGPLDFYAFIPGRGGLEQLRHDFVRLTGRVPLPPLYAFGLWNSRYHAYDEKSALAAIRQYRSKEIPLDVFVLDTDWRKGGATGYEINTDLFPDMTRFVERAHEENVYLVLNDHPQSLTGRTIDEEELQLRYDGLTSILSTGVDAWWYDRNWHAHLKEPAPGLREEVWGMRLYHDITMKYRPWRRPLILSNVDGIDHGVWKHPSHPAAHRYPVWWTGDTHPTWEYLQKGIANGVNSGILNMLPYVSEDLGGHFGRPTDEFYIRSLQYGAFSPIMRLHSSGPTRYPWDFGESVEKIATDYIRLRYRLLPFFYSAARRSYDDATPLLRRCDLYWPEYDAARNDQQYLLGDDLLVAPVNDVKGFHPIPDTLLHLDDGRQGVSGEYFANMRMQGNPAAVRIDPNIDFNWGEGKDSYPVAGMPEDHFSVRWRAKLGPLPASGRYAFGVTADDGVRLWIDGRLIVDAWKEQSANLQRGEIKLEKGKMYDLQMDYYDNAFKASCKLEWWNLDDHAIPSRNVWIPPGEWQDVWTGSVITGPRNLTVSSELWHMPLYVRQGGIVFSSPQVQSTQTDLWSKIIVDAFLSQVDATTIRVLYEDDGISEAYKDGAYGKTPVTFARQDNRVLLKLGKRDGDFGGSVQKRTWTVRLHCPRGESVDKLYLNHKEIMIGRESKNDMDSIARLLHPLDRKKRYIFMGRGERPAMKAGPVLELKIPGSDVRQKQEVEIHFSSIERQ